MHIIHISHICARKILNNSHIIHISHKNSKWSASRAKKGK